jgi:glutamine amidotransferase
MYFVHSFTAVCEDDFNSLAKSEYGGFDLTAVVKSGNVYGCQFHPEKSGEAGLRLLNSFIKTTQ